jgi:hypothetical protein
MGTPLFYLDAHTKWILRAEPNLQRALCLLGESPSALMLKDQGLMRLRDLNARGAAHESRLDSRIFINYN